jgi:hypothetical protein
VLPEIFSKEPLGPGVRHDFPWFTVVKWTQDAMLNSEEYGVTSRSIGEMVGSKNPQIRRLLGTGTLARVSALKMTEKIINAVGNYGESFERNVGFGSPLNIARGYNTLWSKWCLAVRSSYPFSNQSNYKRICDKQKYLRWSWAAGGRSQSKCRSHASTF